jgi:hypothetical protein
MQLSDCHFISVAIEKSDSWLATADFFRVLCCFIRINTGPIGDDVSKKFHFDKDANLVRQIEGEKTYHVHFSFIFSPEG